MKTPVFYRIPTAQSFLRKTPRFGWDNSDAKRPSPHQFSIAIRYSDLEPNADMDNPKPAKSLVHKITRQLKGLENNRFVVLTGTKRLLGSADRARTFQENLMKELYGALRADQPETFTDARYNLLCQLIKGYGPATAMHWDFKQWPFLSISYEHAPELRNSLPFLADSAQLFHDLKQVRQGDADRPDQIVNANRQLMQDRYLMPLNIDTVSDVPIMIFNNTRWNGIMHGVQRPEAGSLPNATFEDKRTIYQVALSGESFPDHKYSMLKFHQHKKVSL